MAHNHYLLLEAGKAKPNSNNSITLPYSFLHRVILYGFTAFFALSVSAISLATSAGTPDMETPAVETFCDTYAGKVFGLCNAYCEAMDCHETDAHASEQACSKLENNILGLVDKGVVDAQTAEIILACGNIEPPEPVSCPCSFDKAATFALQNLPSEVAEGTATLQSCTSIQAPGVPRETRHYLVSTDAADLYSVVVDTFDVLAVLEPRCKWTVLDLTNQSLFAADEEILPLTSDEVNACITNIKELFGQCP